jgi:hypothetical protein
MFAACKQTVQRSVDIHREVPMASPNAIQTRGTYTKFKVWRTSVASRTRPFALARTEGQHHLHSCYCEYCYPLKDSTEHTFWNM